MSALSPLLTILQISDLHIGHIDPVTGDAQVNAATQQLFANCGWFDGVLGHHARGLEDLDDFFWHQLPNHKRTFLLVVSGDLTRVGDGQEFHNANAFLGAQLVLPGKQVGLRRKNWRARAIPGNHDHWPGLPVIWGSPHPQFANYFPAGSLPYLHNIPLGNRRLLQIVGINTDSDVHPRRLQRFRAVGSFQSQLAAAAPLLGRRTPDQIRVLLMHHSWHRGGFILRISRASRAALEQFLTAQGIQILMTGHTHVADVRPFVPQGGQPTLECRCGTTTQVDQVPYAWKTVLGFFPVRKWPENTLLVHRLYADHGNQVRWEVETFYRDRAAGFQTVGPRGQSQVTV
jgi:predicted phosphodiesterase